MKLAVREEPLDYVDDTQKVFSFLALGEIFASLERDSVHTILDLGPVWQSNIEFYSGYRCKLFVEDLYRCMHEQLFQTGADSQKDVTAYLQTYPVATTFDVILFWDLFDYLTPEQIQALLQHFIPYCRKGTKLFSVTSTSQKIPDSPAQFKIIDGTKLHYETTSNEKTAGPEYNQTKLSRIMPQFRLTRAFRMSSGVEETVFVYQGD